MTWLLVLHSLLPPALALWGVSEEGGSGEGPACWYFRVSEPGLLGAQSPSVGGQEMNWPGETCVLIGTIQAAHGCSPALISMGHPLLRTKEGLAPAADHWHPGLKSVPLLEP